MYHFDDSNPQYLIIYTGGDHPIPEDYRNIGKHWVARLERGERFGVIYVDEPHTHTHDDEDSRQHEAELNRLMNDFRRDYRDQTSKLTVGYARVMPPEWKQLFYPEPGSWENALEHNDRYAQYSRGIPGGGFTDLTEAKGWIVEQFNRIPDQATVSSPKPAITNGHVGMFYGSSTGVTEYVAYEIADASSGG